jgi:peptidylglycine monooxygenase
VSGWLVKEDETGVDQWTLLGSRDPQLPQMFVPVVNTSLVISQGRFLRFSLAFRNAIAGDVLAARCSMENTENRVVGVGASGDDEMCNFYLMYWVDGDETLRDNTCYSSGPPGYYWTTEAGLNHIPK